ncbi:MAG: xanthine dehydrogenase family protein molybdopterin-binding subunit [Candidatus Marinimicrobia bacterium]|nr:xanthine dehydrogenase family protein molybdopterin-binding subunit [Candidatus Neomarinimicrobiota bacterium]
MLYAKTVRSTKAKAKITAIKLPDIPKDYYVVDRNDVPGVNRMRTVVSDHPIFAEEDVQYIGQPILLVVGPDREIIYKIVSQIEIKYQEEEALFTLEEAEKRSTVFTDYNYKKSDPKKAFEQAVRIIEDEYSTGYQEHVYLEPQGIAAEYKDDTLFVYGSMQCPFYVKNALLETMALPEEKIRVVQTVTGGAFGGKEEFPSLNGCHVAVATHKTRQPVVMIYDRDEDILCSTKRHPSITRFKAGLDEYDQIIALDIDVLLNAGAYNGLSPVVLQRAIFSATNVYNIEHLNVRGRNFMTNLVPSGAYRGFGAPQTIFGIEMMFQDIALILGIDPLEYKMRHLLKQNDPTCTGGSIHEEVKMKEIVQKAVEQSDYYNKLKTNKKYQGIGISLFLHGCGFTGKGETLIKGKIILQKNKDVVILKVSSVEMGQGAETVLPKIVAHTLDIPIEKVIYETVDTGLIPDSGPTVASRTTMIVGGLLRECALEMKARWDEAETFEVSKIYKHPDFLHWDDDTFHGDAYPVHSWGANVAEVEIDPITYELTIKKITAVFDVGVPIDERALIGQMQGGIVQGIGWATIEVMKTANGKLIQKNLTDYKIPTSMDVPGIDCDFVLNPYEFGPFGAKCAGELSFVGSPPAVAAAVENALGKPIKDIPITPEMLMEIDNDH